jgi:hypothetical protein
MTATCEETLVPELELGDDSDDLWHLTRPEFLNSPPGSLILAYCGKWWRYRRARSRKEGHNNDCQVCEYMYSASICTFTSREDDDPYHHRA